MARVIFHHVDGREGCDCGYLLLLNKPPQILMPSKEDFMSSLIVLKVHQTQLDDFHAGSFVVVI